jgi:hypothetical protein
MMSFLLRALGALLFEWIARSAKSGARAGRRLSHTPSPPKSYVIRRAFHIYDGWLIWRETGTGLYEAVPIERKEEPMETVDPRALSFTEALKVIEASKYTYDKVPEGFWTGVLDCKVWGRNTREGVYPLHCYFTGEDGGKYQLTAFRAKGNAATYAPSDGKLDVSRVPVGARVRVSIGRNRVGRVKWLSAELAPSENVRTETSPQAEAR